MQRTQEAEGNAREREIAPAQLARNHLSLSVGLVTVGSSRGIPGQRGHRVSMKTFVWLLGRPWVMASGWVTVGSGLAPGWAPAHPRAEGPQGIDGWAALASGARAVKSSPAVNSSLSMSSRPPKITKTPGNCSKQKHIDAEWELEVSNAGEVSKGAAHCSTCFEWLSINFVCR